MVCIYMCWHVLHACADVLVHALACFSVFQHAMACFYMRWYTVYPLYNEPKHAPEKELPGYNERRSVYRGKP